MNINYKKSAKLILLLISTILIATASAATYRYMYIDGGVIVGTPLLVWVEGTDSPSGSTISGVTYTVNFNVEPEVPMNSTEVVFLRNNDTIAHNLTISVTVEISATDFTECKIHIYNNSTSAFIDTLDLTTTDSYETYSTNTPLAAGNAYKMGFEIIAAASASGSYSFDIQVEYE